MRDKIVIRGKYASKTAKRPPVQKKRRWETIEKIQLEREVQNLKELIILWWLYLWNPLLDYTYFWIYCSYHTPLLTDRRDFMEHNAFVRKHHWTFPRKQKEINLQGSFGRRLIALSSTVGSCLFLDMWCI
jgi:hypothetical protein